MAAMAHKEEWPTSADDYNVIEKIGQGAFAKVMKAYCKPKDVFVAIKIMDLEKITTSFEDIRAEVQTMKMTNHPNVLNCYCSFVHKDQLWLVMQLMNKGSCLHAMNQLKKKSLGEGMKEELLAVILKETLQGLQYFHENGQIHRDIKAGNILLDSNGHVLIADFGVSGWMMEGGDRRKNRQTFVGTPCWMAPEVMEQVRGYDYKADIWSFGITALELAKGYAPYARYQPMKVLLLTLQEDPPSLRTYDDDGTGHQFSRHFKDMVRLCLQKDPAKRPSTSTLLKHHFFKKAGTCQFLAAELLSKVDDIGESSMSTQSLPGSGPLYSKDSADDAKYVPGTTWVFDDEDDKPKGAVDDDMDDFASQFDKVSGETYRKE
ncbi:STE/STE20/FRAY protein kinase [Saprolegnia parasitica CBS 223.65]|uniref:STE/STE20/FRAY protein kinase n=1 Tax=Saprolegnia parasitica (strain CBS 223.65) TaxID=695850 RepID=A0A067CRE8_SAPPC|nr:STE/STE20/FRAY protein kinase [Saprolegnia parasitica CBS 223.65]KDO31815.1 STE/STE20/FRAY protein kinase [Saprolegnia parasitica CBS 223.65]|eukprot:XP_012197695.1 STE/STE20/FRAY protein kinase [Saprolegnia parasitica CBS 223.65]